MEATPFTLINGKALQIMNWSGSVIPDGWVPLDGRTIDGVILPDRRANFIYGTPMDNAADTRTVYVITEIVKLHDLVMDGELKIQGIFPALPMTEEEENAIKEHQRAWMEKHYGTG
jgi:hypothetical protein